MAIAFPLAEQLPVENAVLVANIFFSFKNPVGIAISKVR